MGRRPAGGFGGPVMDPREVTEELLPRVDSLWQDSYTFSERVSKVVKVTDAGYQIKGASVWYIEAEEQFGFNRHFHMLAHGFLTRYVPVEDEK